MRRFDHLTEQNSCVKINGLIIQQHVGFQKSKSSSRTKMRYKSLSATGGDAM